jgi:hypothetical protein
MKKIARTVLLLVFSFAFPSGVSADPGATVNRLMDTPVSLFSAGLDKLSIRLDNLSKSGIFVIDGSIGGNYSFGGATFDWDTSKITTYITRYTKPEVDPTLLEEECKNSIQALRSMAGLNTDGTLAKDLYSEFTSSFFPTGYSLKKLTVEDGKTIDAMITLKVQILNYSKKSKLVCNAPLLGTGYSVEK